jgi:phage protein U
MYAQLGDIKFEGMLGFTDLDHSSSANYAEHALILGKPRLQRVGTNLDEVKATMLFHSRFCDPEAQISSLYSAMLDGEVMPFINGAGDVVGDFVITNISRRPEQTDALGRLIAVEVDVTMREFYDAEMIKRREEEAKANGFANAQNDPIQSIASVPPQTLQAAAAADITAATADFNNVSNDLKQVTEGTSSNVEDSYRRAERGLTSMKDRTASAIEKINETTGAIYDDTRDLADDLNDVLSTINSLQTAVGIRDAVLAATGLDALSESVDNLQKTNAILVGIVATRR